MKISFSVNNKKKKLREIRNIRKYCFKLAIRIYVLGVAGEGKCLKIFFFFFFHLPFHKNPSACSVCALMRSLCFEMQTPKNLIV